MAPKYTLQTLFSRRELLGLMGAAGAAFVAACGGDGDSSSPTATVETTGATATAGGPTAAATSMTPEQLACVLTPELTEGPFFVDDRLNRSDIRSDPATGESVEGIELTLILRAFTVEGGSCAPLSGATIDVWHCDVEGRYSGVAQNDTVGQQFLRGSQTTNEEGIASFTTIYPGWYTGRAVHIHFKVRQFDGDSTTYEFTSQLFFDDSLTDFVYADPPYNARPERDTRNDNDSIFAQGGEQLVLNTALLGDEYAATFNFGVQL
jgi:protocatechuate 3,4-dioxygenase beta subunit